MELFTSEQTGMILSGPHSLGFITTTNPGLEGKLGSFVIPRGEAHVSISGIGGYAISESCENKDVAADYMKFITSKENAIYFGQKTGRMPTRTEASDDPYFSSVLFKGFLGALDYAVDPETFASIRRCWIPSGRRTPTCCPAWPHLTRLTGRWWRSPRPH